jgi:phosphoglycerate dehydrogenase-like enzyme
MAKSKPTIIIEDDVWLRLIGVVLDPTTSRERWDAFADFMSPDLPDFCGWCDKAQQVAGALYPSDVKLVKSQVELREKIGSADAIVVESMTVGAEELALAPNLKAVHKYGMLLRGIDVAACEARNVEVLGVRRRANIACAEHAFALMLSLARKLGRLSNLVSVDQLPKDRLPYRPFDRRHTPGANWGRFSGTQTLYGDTIGVIGLGEIGREIASRATAFGMKTLYYQRTQLPQDDENKLSAIYCSLESLLASSDWVVPQLPYDDSTARFIGRERLAQMKQGACIVNVSRPELLDRPALLEALRTGHLGGLGMDGLYEEPGRADDELLSFGNVVLTPHMGASPRTNGLQDIEDMIRALAQALAK